MRSPHACPATTHSYLARAAESLQRGDHGRATCPPATPAPTSPRCGPPPRCSPPGPSPAPRGAGARRTPGCCSPRSPPSWRSGPRFFAAGAAKRAAAEAGLDPGGHRARGRRPGPRRRPVPRRGRAGARPGAPRPAAACRRSGRAVSPDPFVHLHVASGYSLQYGASHPHVAGRAGRRAGDGHPRAHRPRRHLRRGEVRPGLPRGRHPAGARASTSPYRPAAAGRDRRAGRAPVGRRCAAARSATRRWAACRGSRCCRGRRSWPAAGPAGRRSAGWSRRSTWPGSAAARWPPSTCSRRTWPAATCWCCSGRPPSSARPRPGAATTWPGRARAVARVVPRGEPPRRAGLPPARRPRGATGGRAPRRTPPGWPASPGAAGLGDGAHQRGPLRRPPRRPHRRRPRRRPPAGRRSTGATSTGATPRASSSPASRCTRSPRRSAGWPGSPTTAAGGATAARPHPRGRRPVRARPARRPRARRGALPRVRPLSDAPGRRAADVALRAPLRGGDRRPLRLGAAAADLEAPRRRARDDPRPRLRVLLPHRRRRHRPDPARWGSAARPAGRARAAWSTTCSASPGSTRSATAC